MIEVKMVGYLTVTFNDRDEVESDTNAKRKEDLRQQDEM